MAVTELNDSLASARQDPRPAARALFRDAVAAQPPGFSPRAVPLWFEEHAPWVPPLLVEGLFISGTVNEPARRHYPHPDDVVFRRDDGRYERYKPEVQGWWSTLGLPAPAPIRWRRRARPEIA